MVVHYNYAEFVRFIEVAGIKTKKKDWLSEWVESTGASRVDTQVILMQTFVIRSQGSYLVTYLLIVSQTKRRIFHNILFYFVLFLCCFLNWLVVL